MFRPLPPAPCSTQAGEAPSSLHACAAPSASRKRQCSCAKTNRSSHILCLIAHLLSYRFRPLPPSPLQQVLFSKFLTKMPQVIYLHFEDAPWTVHDDLGQGVYPLTPVSRTWQLNKKTKVKIRRTGFFLVPDFATTAHMIEGQSVG